jgi:hypothetical protein
MKINQVIEGGHRDAYQRDYDSSISGMDGSDRRDFKRHELQHELGHERNNIAIAINGKTWKVVPGKGYADSAEERAYLNGMKRWAEKKSDSSGKKWSVHLTGADPSESVNEEEMGKVSQATAKDVTIDNPDGTKTIAPLARLTKDAQGNLSLGKPVAGAPAVPGQPATPPADQEDKIQMGQQVRLSTTEAINHIGRLAGLSK